MKKAQISLEFVIIFGIGLTLILVLGSMFFSFSSSQQAELGKNQLSKILEELSIKGEQIYFRGNGNKITYKASFPEGITNFSIHWINESGVFYSYFEIEESASGFSRSHFSPISSENILFACEHCFNDSNENKSFWYQDYMFSSGPKTIVIKAKNNQVYFDFLS
jgi:hypothetical protein